VIAALTTKAKTGGGGGFSLIAKLVYQLLALYQVHRIILTTSISFSDGTVLPTSSGSSFLGQSQGRTQPE
jgi:hypothetical protein